MQELIEIQSKLKAPKAQRNTFGGYNYRNCEDILEAVKPLLAENGAALTLSDEIVRVGDDTFVKATATFYAGGKSLSVSAFARHPVEKKGMDASQITGATSSYARKYALNGLFCIDDTRDADATDDHGEPVPPLSPAPVNRSRGNGTGNPPARDRNPKRTPASPASPAPAAPANGNDATMMLTFMGNLGVSREMLEAAVGARVEDFTEADKKLIKNAARRMRAESIDFQTAITPR